MGKEVEKVKCQYCGKEIAKAGLKNHEKSCSENPENMKKEEEVVTPVEEVTGEAQEPNTEKVEEKQEPEKASDLTIVPEDAVQEKLVEICMKESIDCYIGDRYWRLKAGDRPKVPENVKEILNKAGMLKPL